MPIFAKSGTEGVILAKFIDSLLSILGGKSFREVIKAIGSAYPEKRPVVSAMGAYVIKCGLSTIVIDLMKRGIVRTIALNRARAIHDFQVALIGETSEDVTTGLETGMFRIADETGKLINEVINERKEQGVRNGIHAWKKLTKMEAP